MKKAIFISFVLITYSLLNFFQYEIPKDKKYEVQVDGNSSIYDKKLNKYFINSTDKSICSDEKYLCVKEPIISIQYDELIMKYKRPGLLKVINEEAHALPINLKISGNTTHHLPKKNLRLEFSKKKDWMDSYKRNFLGMGEAADWKLKAYYSDKSMARDFINLEIYTKILKEFFPSYRFVHVFVNGHYNGPYLLFKHINRFGLGLEKRIEAPLWVDHFYNLEHKSYFREIAKINKIFWSFPIKLKKWFDLKDMSNTFLFKHKKDGANFDITFEGLLKPNLHDGVFQKYPDDKYFNSISEYDAVVKRVKNHNDISSFDEQSVLNYLALLMFNSGRDNTVKNFYIYRKKNEKIKLIPWDLDWTFGQEGTNATFDSWLIEDSLLFKIFLEDSKRRNDLSSIIKKNKNLGEFVKKTCESVWDLAELNNEVWQFKRFSNECLKMKLWTNKRLDFVIKKLESYK